MIRQIVKRLLSPILKRSSALYLKKARIYRYDNIYVKVEPGVFPPFLTISTKILLEFLKTRNVFGKRFLELGCGCGIISILAAKNGAIVTASDINAIALDALQKNAQNNEVAMTIVESDLFDALSEEFDIIFINPPYYPRDAGNIAEKAWFCGTEFEYFEKLFLQLPQVETYMILSEDCNIDRIMEIAAKNSKTLVLESARKVAGEKNFIFRIV